MSAGMLHPSNSLKTLLIDNYDSYTYNVFQLIAIVYGSTHFHMFCAIAMTLMLHAVPTSSSCICPHMAVAQLVVELMSAHCAQVRQL